MPLFRHGDVLVLSIDAIPDGVRRRPHLILAEGEITGHYHRIAEPESAELFALDGELYLRVTASHATVIHEEHGPIRLTQGSYRVWRQREYSPKSIQTVRD